MKKTLSILLAAVMLTCSFSACGKHTSSSSTNTVTGESRKGESAEDALREIYDAVYTADSGEVCLSYMYPQLTISALKEQGLYDTSVQNYNTGQKGYIDLIEQKPEIISIDKTTAFTEEQLKAANEYFAAVSAQAGIYTRSSSFNAVEGYQFDCTVTNTIGEQESDVECMIYLENDGWKNVPFSIEGLTSIADSYDEDKEISALEEAGAEESGVNAN